MSYLTPRDELLLTRRELISFMGSSAVSIVFLSILGCERHYERPQGTSKLGLVKNLLKPRQHISAKSMLVFRDENGWSVLSTQCTYDGCDLSYGFETLLCQCCKSEYFFRGDVLRSPTKRPLPWYKIFFKEGHLYAQAGDIVDKNYRFTTPELEAQVKQLLESVAEATSSNHSSVKIPDILSGSGTGQKGAMFRSYDPDTAKGHELE